MDRRKFLSNLGTPVVAACAVCMGACSKSNSSGSGGGSANFTVDLSSQLLGVGSSLVSNGVIIVRLATGNVPASFSAVQVNCTHEGTAINYNAASNQFICPNHGSTFTTSGAVTLGPANRNLKQYTISISGNTMTVVG
ncbi:MAG: Rieske 2Fe-2S domain-containing protein [Chitinophagaceae bacterium]|jgi:Rieske Fe-S protein|nr:Rieske 2Fe-2S domain-containing protein [Chitinophagaceae bacterium]